MNNRKLIKCFIFTLIKESFFNLSIPTDEDVKKVLLEFFPNPDDLDIPEITQQIQMIFDKKDRYLLNVFSLDRDENVAKTIFKAIFISR
jgi:hypothetical protein